MLLKLCSHHEVLRMMKDLGGEKLIVAVSGGMVVDGISKCVRLVLHGDSTERRVAWLLASSSPVATIHVNVVANVKGLSAT